DTGIGIAPEDQERIFQEFTQIDSPLQQRVKGTGLGLPLTQKLASLLGGRLTLESSPGVGSTFTAVIPILYDSPAAPADWDVDPRRTPVLFVDESPETLRAYERMLAASEFQLLGARSVRDARQGVEAFRPRAIVIHPVLRGEGVWELLTELKR